MKWLIISLVLLWLSMLASADVVGGMIPVAGGSSGYDIVCGPPLYDYFTGCRELSVNITSPLNGSEHGRNTFTFNTTVSGAGSPICEYKINDNAWNIYDCVGEASVTFPANDVTLTVNVTDRGCSTHAIVHFTVYGGPGGGGYFTHQNIAMVSAIGLLAFLVLDGRRRRRVYFTTLI